MNSNFKNRLLGMIALGNGFKAFMELQRESGINNQDKKLFCEQHLPKYAEEF